MSKFLNVLLEKREEEKVEKKYVKPLYDWRYENSVVSGKRKLEIDGDYSQWRTNIILSNYTDLVRVANIMSENYHVTDQMHYDFLYGYIRKFNRKGGKKETDKEKKDRKQKEELLNLISEYYKYNTVRSKEALRLLTADQIEFIKKKKEKGGVK